MRRDHLGLLVVLAGLVLAVPVRVVAQGASQTPLGTASETAEAPTITDRPRFVAQFLSQHADRATAMHLHGVTLRRDAATFVLEDGDLWFCEPIEGQVRAAVFSGTGTFTAEPPTAFERAELTRFCKAPVLERKFKTLVLVFADSTCDELRGRGTATQMVPSGDATEALTWYLDAIGDKKTTNLELGIEWPCLNGRHNGSFYSYVLCDDGKPVFFEIDPLQHEEVSLWRVPPAPFLTKRSLDQRELVSQFPRGGRYDTTAVGWFRPDVTVEGYHLDCAISSVLEFSAAAELRCRTAIDRERWIPLRLYSELDVDSVSWDQVPAAFARGRGSEVLWVRPPVPAGRDEEHVMRVRYHGHLLHSAGDWIMLRSTIDWYPRTLATHDATFDLTFHAPSEYLLRSVGEEVEHFERDRMTHTRWAVRRPSRNATFVLGRFREQGFASDGTPPVVALMVQGTPSKVVQNMGDVSVVEGARLQDWVVEDVAQCVAFYQERLGPAQVPGFVVGQTPATIGEAFPGLINIPQTAFVGATAVVEDEVFRSHEVAHQWWGYTVAGRTYHDHWLEEGFANFSALWYMQSGLKRNRDYLDLLQKWSDDLFQDSEVRPEGGRVAGPIWLGYRNSSTARPDDYAIVDYKKGAWVLQMLRTMLLDLDSMDDSRFTGLMKEFYQSFAGGTASTADFQRIAEKYAGEDLGWFFDQWVYGTGLPTCRFAWNSEKTADGKYRVSCRVEQGSVAAGFRMPVILRVEFGEQQFAWVRRTVAGPETRFDLPLLPAKPTRIVFNDVASVLCRVKTESW